MRYGYPSSPWSALGQGLANGYLLKLQQQMQERALMQKMALERQEQERLAGQDAAGLDEVSRIIQDAMPPTITAGAPITGAEDLRPAGEQEGFGQPQAFQQQPLNVPGLVRAGGKSPTASKLKADPQFYQLLQSAGVMSHPDVVKQQGLRTMERQEAEDSPDANPILAEMFPGMTAEKMAVLRRVVPGWKELLTTGKLTQGAEGLDLKKAIFELNKLIEAGGTVKSAEQIKNVQANTGLALERTNTEAGTNPLGGAKIKNIAANTDYTQERTKTEAGTNRLGGARIENTLANIEDKYGRTPLRQQEMEERAARTEKIKKETQFVGQPKPKGPTPRDQDVETYMRHFDGMTDEKIEATIARSPASMQAKMRQAKQALFDQKRKEIESRAGRSEGGSSLSGQRTSKPDGTYQLPDGRTVTVRAGVIQ